MSIYLVRLYYSRLGSHIPFLIGALSLLFFVYHRPVIPTGDGIEYLFISQSLVNHASPDLRIEDIKAAKPILETNGIRVSMPYRNYLKTKNGRYYSRHFWVYSLFAVPARTLLRIFHANELKGFQISNTIIFLLALYFVLFRGHSAVRKRILFAALSAIGPVLVYFCRTTTEMFTWSLVVLSLVEIDNRNYVKGALIASIAAMQNPPVMFLAAYSVFLSFRFKGLKSGLKTAAAAGLSFVPAGFFFIVTGFLNPIIAAKPSYRLISPWRTWSFFTDLNQGLLLFLPFLVILLVPAVFRVFLSRDIPGLGLCVVVAAMIMGVQLTGNWNSGGAGMMRYAVWISPVIAWLITDFLTQSRWTQAVGICSVIVHALLLFINNYPPKHMTWRPPAAFILSKMPRLYDPEPEIFVERQLGMEVNAWQYREVLPVAFILPDGNVTKILLDGKNLSNLPDIFDVDPKYFESLQDRYLKKHRVFCLTPPIGAIRDPNRGVSIPTLNRLHKAVHLELLDTPFQVGDTRHLQFTIRVANKAQVALSNSKRGNLMPLKIEFRIRAASSQRVFSRTGSRSVLDAPLRPGESLATKIKITLPPKEGEYLIEMAPQLYKSAWSQSVRGRAVIYKYGRQFKIKVLSILPGRRQRDDPGKNQASLLLEGRATGNRTPI
jgi:hypothetical protein